MTQSRPGCKALLQPWEYHEMQKVGYPCAAVASSQSTAWPVKNGICLDFVCLILGSGSLAVLQSYTEAHSGCKALLQPWEYHEMQKVGYPSSLAGAALQCRWFTKYSPTCKK